MFEELSLEFKDDHLYLNHGKNFEITPGVIESFWSYLRERCQNYGCTSILIEADAPRRDMDTGAARANNPSF